MNKVPVGASIAHAYQFLFGRFFQIIGTGWLPGLLFGLVVYALLSGMHDLGPMHAPPPSTMAGMAIWALCCAVFFIAIRSVLAISLTQEALGVRKDLTLAHFVIGPRELRLFFGYLRYILLAVVLAIVVAVIAAVAFWAAQTYGAKLVVSGHPVAMPLAGLLVLVLHVALMLSLLRLFFMLAPVASAEHRTRLSRAWAISHHSTWRILFVCLGTFLPLMLAAYAVLYYAVGPNAVQALVHAMQAKPHNAAPLVDFITGHAAMIATFNAVVGVIGAALLAGASATAYRVTTGHEDPEPEDDAALVAPLLAPVVAAEPVVAEPVHHETPHDHGHGHEDHGHSDHGHGHGEDHGHGHHESHGSDEDDGDAEKADHGHSDHGHGAHDSHASEDEDDGEDDDDDDEDAGHGHADHAHGHSAHGHSDHGHDDHHHHAKAADEAA